MSTVVVAVVVVTRKNVLFPSLDLLLVPSFSYLDYRFVLLVFLCLLTTCLMFVVVIHTLKNYHKLLIELILAIIIIACTVNYPFHLASATTLHTLTHTHIKTPTRFVLFFYVFFTFLCVF